MEVWKIFWFTILIQSVVSQIFTLEQQRKIEEFINKAIACRSVPGLTFGLVHKDKTWTKGFGFADVEKKKPVDSNTLFGIGSITKAFTATLLAIQLDKSNKNYTWDSKLSDILGSDFKLNSDLRTKETTIKDILCHRTGLQQGNIGIFVGFPKNFTSAKITNLLQYLDGTKPFRDGFLYNNWMYGLAGYLVEVLSGKTWLEELQASILDPIGMTATKVLATNIAVDDERVATPYVMNNQAVPSAHEIYDINPEQAAGAMASSANDMVKWIQVILNRGNTTDGQVIANSEILKHAFDPHSSLTVSRDWTKPTYPVSQVTIGYGYGWFIGNYDGYKTYYHSGGLHGFSSFLRIFPELKIGMYININGPGSSPMDLFNVIMSYVFDILMDKEPWLNTTTACTFPMPWSPVPEVPNTTDDLTNESVNSPEQYTGVYGHRLFGEAHITNDNGLLKLKLGMVEGILNTTTKNDFFKMQFSGPLEYISFQTNITKFIPITFYNNKAGKFQELRFFSTDNTVFERGVKWMPEPPSDDKSGASHPKYTLSLSCLSLFLCYLVTFDL